MIISVVDVFLTKIYGRFFGDECEKIRISMLEKLYFILALRKLS